MMTGYFKKPQGALMDDEDISFFLINETLGQVFRSADGNCRQMAFEQCWTDRQEYEQ
jgi:hypothetical protein